MEKPELMEQLPYLEQTTTRLIWNREFPQDAECACGHPYYRHFDGYDNMWPCGCKYCPCYEWKPNGEA